MRRVLFFVLAFVVWMPGEVLGQQSDAFSSNQLWLSSDANLQRTADNASAPLPDLFNFNPVIDISSEEAVYKNMLSEYFSVFAVFKTNGDGEESVFKLSTRKQKIKVTRSFVDYDQAIAFDKSDPSKGVILSYIGRMEHFSRKNSLSFKDFYRRIAKDPENNQLVEVLYFPKVLNGLERAKVESYLSIKYGISLIGEKNYITSKRDTIWSHKKNKGFTHNITGLGRDQGYGLDQKQSSNVLKDGLSIGLENISKSNAENEAIIADGTFILWGDNNESTQFSNNTDQTMSVMPRVWKLQTSELEGATTQALQIQLDPIAMNLNLDDQTTIWLAINDTYQDSFNYDTATLYKAAINDRGIVTFDDVALRVANKKFQYFTFFKAPVFFAQAEVASNNCVNTETTEVTLDFNGGQAPFSIEATSDQHIVTKTTEELSYLLELAAGDYLVKISDNLGQEFETVLAIEKDESPSVSLAPIWELDVNGQVHVLPTVTTTDSASLSYTWYEEDTVLSKGLQHTFRSEGQYEFGVKTANGCETRFPVEITKDVLNATGDSALFPNPVQVNEPFTLSLNLETPSKVTIRIFNAGGQLISTDKLSKTQQLRYRGDVSSSGTYFVSVQTDQVSKTFKLLVK